MPKTSVIILHHLNENQSYLDKALAGLQDQNSDFETIVIASSVKPPRVPGNVKLVHDPDLNMACKKFNAVERFAHPESERFLFHSDDVVLAKDALSQMIHVSSLGDVIQSPLSNSDVGSRYWIPGSLRPDMDLDDAALHDISIISGRYEGLILKQEWVCFFCPMISRKTWNKVGLMDLDLESRYCDVDYCLRAAALGVPSVINAGAFAFHFGSKTLSKITKPETYAECDKVWLAKLSKLT